MNLDEFQVWLKANFDEVKGYYDSMIASFLPIEQYIATEDFTFEDFAMEVYFELP